MNRITAMYPPFYRRLEFCNLLIRGRLPEVLIAEPCINFTRCRAGFSADEGCAVEQTAREAAVLLRVRWCEFAWLIGLVALAIILGGPFVGVFLDSRAAGRGRVCWEVGVAWIFASRPSFGEGAGRFCQCLLGAVLRGPQYYKVGRCAGGRGCFGVKDLDPKIPPFAKAGKSGAFAKSEAVPIQWVGHPP